MPTIEQAVNMNATHKLNSFFSVSFPGRQISQDEDIFASGFANSMFAMQLVNFIEKEFQVEIENEDLDIDNFRTIRRIADLVDGKLLQPGL